MKKFTFAIVYPSGRSMEMKVSAPDEKTGRKKVWDSFSEHQQSNIESIDLIDEG